VRIGSVPPPLPRGGVFWFFFGWFTPLFLHIPFPFTYDRVMRRPERRGSDLSFFTCSGFEVLGAHFFPSFPSFSFSWDLFLKRSRPRKPLLRSLFFTRVVLAAVGSFRVFPHTSHVSRFTRPVVFSFPPPGKFTAAVLCTEFFNFSGERFSFTKRDLKDDPISFFHGAPDQLTLPPSLTVMHCHTLPFFPSYISELVSHCSFRVPFFPVFCFSTLLQ